MMMISVGSDILEIARVERLQRQRRSLQKKNAGKAREKLLVLPVILV